MVVLNSSSRTPREILAQNQATDHLTSQWIRTHTDHQFRAHLLRHPDLPLKHAGVGLARKIGMDEALRRFHDLNRLEGVMACFDADCLCDPNYLVELDSHFTRHPRSPGCSIHFEHPLEGPLDPVIYEAVAAYELHLRYYIGAQRFAGFPFAYQTVGSAMAIRAGAYMKQGGMNKRQAGEDFYFLNKIIALGQFTELNATRVIPSPRPSDRVPFGTGKAVRARLENQDSGPAKSYPFQAFRDLRQFLGLAPAFYGMNKADIDSAVERLPESIRSYLQPLNISKSLLEMGRHTASASAFEKRIFRWFDAFQIMKFVHHARDHYFGAQEITEAAGELLRELGLEAAEGTSGLLKQYRGLVKASLAPENT